MEPIPDDRDFRWSKAMYHFTYAAFLDIQELLMMCQRITTIPVTGWSYAWEDTTKTINGTTHEGHQHTHFLVMFKSRLNLTGSRKFDLLTFDEEGVGTTYHPNVQSGLTMNHVEFICTNYHAGRKFDVEKGAMSYTAPIKRELKLPQNFNFTREIINAAIACTSLLEACIETEVRPRSVNDLKILRDESAQAPKRFKPLYTFDTFKQLMPTSDWGVVHVHGPSGVGKTKACLVQFVSPLHIKPFDSIGCLESLMKQYDPKIHDGLVLDEADLKFMTRQQVIAFFDQDEACTLDVRYKSFSLPAGLKKIIISNPPPQDLYPADPHGAIARRVKYLHVTQPTWIQAPVHRPPAPRAPLHPIQPVGAATALPITNAVIETPATAIWHTQ